MPGVFDLSHVLQLVIDRLNDGALAQQHLVGDTHQGVLHLVFQFGYQLNAIDKEFAEQVFTNVSPVGDDLSVEFLCKTFHLERVPVIHVARREHEIDDLAHFVADDVQFEAEEPPHRAFPSLGEALEGLVLEDPLVPANPQRGAINETDAGALAHQNGLDKYGQLNDRAFLEFNETIVRHDFRKEMPHVLAHMIEIEMLQTSIARAVEQHKNRHHLGIGHGVIPVILSLLC